MKAQPRLLIVDDDVPRLILLEAMLVHMNYEVHTARTGEEALQKAGELDPDVILMDVNTPGMDGFAAVRRLRACEKTRLTPIVLLSSLHSVEHRIQAIEAGADDFIPKPVEKTELWMRVESLVKVKAYHDHLRAWRTELEFGVGERTSQVTESLRRFRAASLETIYRLARLAESKDGNTGAHVQRVSWYSATVARQMGMEDQIIEQVLYGAPLHDVGNIGIPDQILLKPGRLAPDEWQTMKTHTALGGSILEGAEADLVRAAEAIAIGHHEKWDGSGYPNKVVGASIPLLARITAIADVFDALSTKRPYKEALSTDDSFSIIEKEGGRHFDPDVTAAFLFRKRDILTIHRQFMDRD